jgi:hypothetical protein
MVSQDALHHRHGEAKHTPALERYHGAARRRSGPIERLQCVGGQVASSACSVRVVATTSPWVRPLPGSEVRSAGTRCWCDAGSGIVKLLPTDIARAWRDFGLGRCRSSRWCGPRVYVSLEDLRLSPWVRGRGSSACWA